MGKKVSTSLFRENLPGPNQYHPDDSTVVPAR